MKGSAPPNALSSWQEPSPVRRQLFFLLLILTFVRGVLYLAVLPPWQHYDEPTHFEYVRLIAERGQFPQAGDYDLEVRREIAASTKAAGFWKELGEPAIDFWSDEPPYIGVAELNHPPFYYALLALPQLLVAGQEVDTQLYLGRLSSVFLYVLIVASAYGLVREVLPRRRWLPLAVATFIALLPPLTDLMSAVNNDVGAVAAVTLLMWASARLVRRGLSLGRVAVTVLLAGICMATKSTASVTAIVVLLALGVSFVPRPHRRWLWIGLALLVPVALVVTFTWGGHAAGWYSNRPPAAANRTAISAPLGRSAFALSTAGEPYAGITFQELERTDGQRLQGHIVTLGAWLKAAQEPGAAATLSLRDGSAVHSAGVEVTTDWHFHAFTATIGTDAPGLAAYVILPASTNGAQTVYVDGIILADGEMPITEPPRFETVQAAQGQWGTQEVTNLLRNGSAERGWPGMRGWIGNAKMYRQPISMVFHSVLDWPRTRWTYTAGFIRLFHSFWGRYAWSHLFLPSAYLFPLGLVTIAAIIGCGIVLVRQIRVSRASESWQHRAWAVLGVACLVGWGGAMLRVHPLFMTFNYLWPMARYAAVAIVPTAALLCLGLAEIIPRRWIGLLAFAGLLGMVTLDAIALLTVIVPFYYG